MCLCLCWQVGVCVCMCVSEYVYVGMCVCWPVHVCVCVCVDVKCMRVFESVFGQVCIEYVGGYGSTACL